MTEDEDKVIVAFPEDRSANAKVRDFVFVDDGTICQPDDVLDGQMGQLKQVLVVGITERNGVVIASSLRRLSDINFLIDVAKTKTCDIIDYDLGGD